MFAVAVLVAILVPQAIWSAFLAANLKFTPAIPWSAAVLAVILWALWMFADGRFGPQSTATARHRYLRANPVPGRTWAWSLTAGLLALGALIALWLVLPAPAARLPDYSKYPVITVAVALVAASVLGAVVEEAGLRGYLFTRLGELVPPPLAILLVSILISPGHGLTQGFALPVLAWYLLADIVFGVMSWLSRSILPGIVVHGLGLLIFFTLIWPTDHVRASSPLTPSVAAFWIALALMVLLALLSLLSFRQLARATSSVAAPSLLPRN